MKLSKMAAIFIAAVMSAGVTVTSVGAVDVYLDGNKVDFSEKEPYISYERTMVPLRPVFEQLGWNVSWDDAAKKATISVNDRRNTGEECLEVIEVTEGTPISNAIKYSEFSDIQVYSKYIVTDVMPELKDGVLMLPLRAVVELIGKRVEWNDAEKSVYITDGVPDDTYMRIGANTVLDDGTEVQNSGKFGVEGLREISGSTNGEELIALIPVIKTNERGVEARFDNGDGGFKTATLWEDGYFTNIGEYPGN